MSIANLLLDNNYDLFCNILRAKRIDYLDPTTFNIIGGAWSPTVSNLVGYVSVTPLFGWFLQIGQIVYASLSFQSVSDGVVDTPEFSLTLPVARTVSGDFVNASEMMGSGTTVELTTPVTTSANFSEALIGSQLGHIFCKRLTANANRDNNLSIMYMI